MFMAAVYIGFSRSENPVNEFAAFLRIELEFPIAAPPERVWNALVRETGRWWPRGFYSDARATNMVFEPRLGGRLYEDWGEGRGRTWFTIETFDPPRVLEMAGHLYPAYGGPSVTLVRLEFVEEGKGTRLKLMDAVCGRVEEGTKKSLEEGWKALFGAGLKSFVEQ
jgi:uncharacterized protein YndB with AHSA1/START domain